MLAALRKITPELALEAFIAGNLGFLAVDIALAHAANHFARREEWWPVVFSVVATLALLPGLFSARLRSNAVGMLVGFGSIAVGVVGMVFHLRSAFFETQTLAALVYSAPFAAPLAYVGLGLLLLMTRMEPRPRWDGWVLFLALGGFVGNLALSLLDHAQNGFFARTEWIPVVVAAFTTSFLFMTVAEPADDKVHRVTAYVLGAAVLTGVLGFVLHLLGNQHRPGPVVDRMIYGAPVFAPLLFADLALLAAIGLWTRQRREA
jgi:hypothetical protein